MVRHQETVTLPATPRRKEFSDIQTYERRVISEAKHFTAIVKTAAGTWWKNEKPTLDEIKEVGARMLEENQKAGAQYHVMIYAVAQVNEVLVGSFVPGKGWKERSTA